jgi:hypothetical protein
MTLQRHNSKFILTALMMTCLSTGCSSGPGGECGEHAKHHNGFTPCRRGYCAPETSDGDRYDICLLYRKLGESCQDGSQCRGEHGDVDAFCDEGVCRATRSVGELCEPSPYGFDPPCQHPLWCAESGTCEPLRELGEPCGRCEEGLRCEEDVCKAAQSG